MTFLKQWWPSILAALVALWGVFGAQIQAEVSMYPTLAIVLSMIGVVIAHLLPSPVASSTATGVIVAKVNAPAPRS